jgi:hypothetical protein
LKVQRLTPETSAKKNIMETRESHTQWSEDIVRYSLEMRRVQNKESVCNEMQDKEGNESFKLGRIKPSSDGLADCKVTSRDADMVIGLYSPFKYGLATYEGYDIKRFKNYIRFMEVIEDRHYGATGNICPLFFNGASSIFYELPKPDNTRELSKVYDYINSLESRRTSKSFFSFMSKPSESKYKLNKLRKEINLGKRNFNIRKIRHR